ncbi:MAG: esterase family protein [Eubacteriales bacterium]|nr:esterase family protein [Eubacteriales bacterium]
MVWSDFHFFSQTLQIQTAAYVLLPEYETLRQLGGGPLPTLYLLHGLSDDHTGWMRDTRIEKYASKYALAVVMPAVNRSFYTDMAHGAKYWTFISEELPRVMESYFPLCTTREGRFVAGLSMGGFGAMKLGLLKPENYAAIAAFSAPLMMQEVYQFPAAGIDRQELDNLFGGEAALRAGENNLCQAAEALTPAGAPRMYVSCGTEDFLFEANQAFVTRYGRKFDIHYETEEGAAHTWHFWDRQIEKVLAWMPLKKVENVW